jgi:hypothetical protein
MQIDKSFLVLFFKKEHLRKKKAFFLKKEAKTLFVGGVGAGAPAIPPARRCR